MKKLQFINLAAGILVVVMLGFAGSYLQKLVNHDVKNAIKLEVEGDCQLNSQLCYAGSGDMRVGLKLQGPVKYLEKFDIELNLQGFAGHKITRTLVDFSMPGMQMGINRFELGSSTQETWQGFAILPVCISGRTDWQVKVYIETDIASYVASFKLAVTS